MAYFFVREMKIGLVTLEEVANIIYDEILAKDIWGGKTRVELCRD